MDEIRRFEGLVPGRHAREPRQGIYGYEIDKLIEIVEAPVPTYAEAEPAIDAYLEREAKCGRQTLRQ